MIKRVMVPTPAGAQVPLTHLADFSIHKGPAGIKSERMAHLYGLVPPPNEQDAIVNFVRGEVDKLRALTIPIDASISRLQEFRTSLITAAVTGQIDVATWGRKGQTDRRLDEIEEAMSA
jgi:type I restriction enzyme S subunit